jgi:hypothetical protein
MPDTASATTTRPARKRAPAKSVNKTATPAKAATPKAVEAPVKTAETPDGKTKIQFDMTALDPSKSYAKFTPPDGSGCVGVLYVPLGVEEVKILLIGPAS